MNPDKFKIWTLKHPDGNIVTFKIAGDNSVKVNCSKQLAGIRNGEYLITAARNMWNEYIRTGYQLQLNSKLNYAMSTINYALEA